MREILTLAIAGGAGTVGRWALSKGATRLLGSEFPYGTLTVNVLGCLLIAVAMETAAHTQLLPEQWRIPLTVGFLGAFTTMSTFGFETMSLVEKGSWGSALANVGANLVLCLGAVWIGLIATRAALA